MTSLILPKSIRPSSIWKKRRKSQSFWQDAKEKFSWRQDASNRQPQEHPGRKYGKPVGGWIDDLVARRKALILCWRCQPKFDHKRADYYRDERFPTVIGRCDGCRTWMNHEAKLYIHNSFLGDPNGHLRPGQCWTPM